MEKRLKELDQAECLQLLAGEHLGRLGVVIDGYPEVLPMQYAIDGDCVIMRTNPGAKFREAPLSHVTFEIDHVDWVRKEGWSVIVHGVAEDITNGIDEQSERARKLRLETWAPGPTHCWIMIIPSTITGRRIAAN